MEKIQDVIANKIRPALQAHHGDIELVEVTAEGIVKVKLTGACATCSGAQQTMMEVVETAIRDVCPDVRKVELVFDVSDELIQQALKILRKNRV
jgi:Fe-S cluster biogenesis protein NfuA